MQSLNEFENALILLNKPEGITSFKAIQQVKKLLKVKKIGHSGTLDIYATGLLVLCTGRLTKLTQYFLDHDKEYECKIQLGKHTDTNDFTGSIVEQHSFNHLEEQSIRKVVSSFIGKISQLPPDFSALKINGKRASDLKRDGREVTLQPRAIEIKKIRIISIDIDKGTIHMQVSCSKGTYIRSLARDIGNQLDVGAHVQSLKRLSSGEFNLADAISIDELESYSSGNNLQKEIKIDPICGFSDYSIVIVNNFAIEKIKHGSQFSMKDVIKIEQNAKKLFTIQNEKKNLIAIADIDTENWHIVYKNVLL